MTTTAPTTEKRWLSALLSDDSTLPGARTTRANGAVNLRWGLLSQDGKVQCNYSIHPRRQAADNVTDCRSAGTPRFERPAQAMARRAMHVPNTPSLQPSETRRPKSAPDKTPLRHTVPHKSTRAVEIAAPHEPPRPTRLPTLAQSADIALTRCAQRAPTSPMITKRPKRSARLTTLSSNQLRLALTARLIIWASQPGQQSTWVGDW